MEPRTLGKAKGESEESQGRARPRRELKKGQRIARGDQGGQGRARQDCLRVPATVCDCLRLLLTACDCLRLPATAFYCLRQPTTACECLRLPATACDCLRLPTTACDCLRLSATAYDCLRLPLRLSVTACDCLRLPRILGGWPDFAHLESENMVPYWLPEQGPEIGGQFKMISFPLLATC